MKWDGRFCEQITKISTLEETLSKEMDNVPLTGKKDFSDLYKKYGEEIYKLSLENCFRNGRLPTNMPEVL